jgi:hypothetical protein
MKIRFLQDRVVRDELRGTPQETRYRAGQEVELADASAQHWIRRGVAQEVPHDTPHQPAAAPPVPAAAPAPEDVAGPTGPPGPAPRPPRPRREK